MLLQLMQLMKKDSEDTEDDVCGDATSSNSGSDQSAQRKLKRKHSINAHDIAQDAKLARHAGNGDVKSVRLLANKLEFQSRDLHAHALHWLRIAADANDASSQFLLSIFLRDGNGIDMDEKLAAEWCRKSAEQGLQFAQHHTAENYYNGWGVAKSLDQALYWCQKAVADRTPDDEPWVHERNLEIARAFLREVLKEKAKASLQEQVRSDSSAESDSEASSAGDSRP